MIRVKLLVEGQTEETFVRDLLAPYFLHQHIYLTPILAQTSVKQKGGVVSYAKIKYQILRLCKQDKQALITSMIDYYRLPRDFPAYHSTLNEGVDTRVKRLEEAFQKDINQDNFIANFMLHEFEALLFCEPEKFNDWLDDGEKQIEQLKDVKNQFINPEAINNHPNTAPSKRIKAIIPNYSKTLHGPLIAEDIGIDNIRSQCPHFNQWLVKIENLSCRT